MSDEAGPVASTQRLTELAQRLNQLNAARYTAIAAENPTQLPPHLIEKVSRPKLPTTISE